MATGKKVLIVEDDPDYVVFLSTVLEKHDYQTIVAADGEEGLAKAREATPDLILLDLMMPKKSGMVFLNEVKRESDLKDIPIIIVSGASKETGIDMKYYIEKRPFQDRKEKALGKSVKAQPEAYLEKPVEAIKLIETVGKFLS